MILSIKKLVGTTAMALLGWAMVSCSDDNGPLPEPGPDPVSTNRTILVYMVASNTLNTYDEADILEMQTAARNGALDGNRLILYHQKYERYGEPELKEVLPTTGEVVTLKKYDNSVSSVSKERMNNVIADVKELAPANDYGLVLWSHANGWRVSSSSPDPLPSGRNAEDDCEPIDKPQVFAFGQETIGGTSKNMNVANLAEALDGKGFSFIYFDCCYMACVEVLYDLRKVTPYVIASTAEIISEGMPYQLSLPYLFAKGKADVTGAAKAVYDYVNAILDSNRTGTFAVFDMSKIDALASATRDFYSFHPVVPASFTPQKYMYETTCYFYDFGHILENMELPDDADPSLAQSFEASRTRVLDAIADATLSKHHTPYIWPGTRYQVPITDFCGMSSQLLRNQSASTIEGYDRTAWWNDVARYQFE